LKYSKEESESSVSDDSDDEEFIQTNIGRNKKIKKKDSDE